MVQWLHRLLDIARQHDLPRHDPVEELEQFYCFKFYLLGLRGVGGLHPRLYCVEERGYSGEWKA